MDINSHSEIWINILNVIEILVSNLYWSNYFVQTLYIW